MSGMTSEPGPPSGAGMRAEVAHSWQRSAAAGVSPESVPDVAVPADELPDRRSAYPLAQVFPLLDDVLGQAVRDVDALLAVCDGDGNLLWVSGSSRALRRADGIGFVEGTNWDERSAGTNAPGLALRLGRPATVTRREHYRAVVQETSCAAAPIHDPVTGSVLGVLDVTGGDTVAVPQTLAMVRAAARMAEAELARTATGPPLVRATSPGAESGVTMSLAALGRTDALLTVLDRQGRSHQLRLSPRHSDIVVVLSGAPLGLAGEELAIQLSDAERGDSTTRVELGRLRKLLGDELLASRPYRLVGGVHADWLEVEALLVAGEVQAALAAYRGPLLPRSEAPGVIEVREALHEALRTALLSARRADLISAWTRSSWGADDYPMWSLQGHLLPARSPLQPLVRANLARLDRAFG